ncbi:type VI secretion system-associated protein TagF, partial [Pseudomonas fluorescens]
GPDAAAGVVMPSIDRVGRYFPLTVAVLLEPDADPASVVGGADDWFERVENLLLSTLNVEASFEAFGAELDSLGSPMYLPRTPGGRFASLHRFDATDPQRRMSALAESACEGASLWWGQGSERIAPGLMRCQGLPAAADFAQFLLGQEGVV